MSGSIPADSALIAATNPSSDVGLFFTVAELREAMSPIGYFTPADQVLTAAVEAAQATANAAIPTSTLGQALGPVQSDVNNLVPLANLPASVLGSSHYLGTWNALLNVPLIQSSVAPDVASPVGGYYIVSVAGTPTINGVSDWTVGDWIIWNGSVWDQISGQANLVSSVVGYQGAVTAGQIAASLSGQNLGTPSGIALTNATGLPLGTGVTGTLAATNAPALSGDVTSTAGSLVVTLATNAANQALRLNGNAAISGQILAENLPGVLTFAALMAYSPPSPLVFVDKQLIRIPYYSVANDNGGGIFQWNAASTQQPDLGMTICPSSNQTSVTGLSLGTGDGTTTTFTVSLGQAGIIPGTVNVFSGATNVATDTGGCGILFGTGVTSSTILTANPALANPAFISVVNYSQTSSTQLTINFATAPASGTAITASFAYANAAGRWIRINPLGVLDVRAFGANTSTDLFYAWKAADNLAVTTGLPVFIPDSGSHWNLYQSMIVLAHMTMGGAGVLGGTIIKFQPTSTVDLTAAAYLCGSNAIIKGIQLSGPETIPTVANLVTSGWIITQATFQGTVAAGVLTLTSAATGTLLAAALKSNGVPTNSISAPASAGMPALPVGTIYVSALLSGTLGASGSTYQLATTVPGASMVAVNVATATTFTQTTLPNYSAFKNGTAGFAVCQSGRMENCSTAGFKAGTVLWSNYGHYFITKCDNGGNNFFNYYCAVNGDDYWFSECSFQPAVFANMLTGNGGPLNGGGHGGIGGGFMRCHPGQSPFGFFQCDNGGVTSGYSSNTVQNFYRCSIEGCSETFFQTLPGVNWQILWHGDTSGGGIASTPLPTSLVPSPATYSSFIGLGQCSGFKVDSNNFGNPFSSGSLGAAFFGTVVSTGGINFDFDVFQGAYTVGVQYPADISFNDRDAQTYYKRWWVQHEHLARQPQGNGLWLPELVPNGVAPSANNHTTNWNANVTGVNVSIATLASLQTTGQPLAGVAVDPRIYAEYPGGNPNVIILTPANSTTFAKAQLWANPLFAPLPNTPLAFRAWATGSITGSIVWSVTGNSGTTLLSRTLSANPAAFAQFGFNGVCLSDAGCTTCDYFQIAGITNQTIYLIAPNLTALDFAPYSLGPLPAGVNYWGEATVANLPGATYLSLGTTAIALNGCNTGEAAGSGTGCPVFVKSVSGTPTWCAVWSGVAVTY